MSLHSNEDSSHVAGCGELPVIPRTARQDKQVAYPASLHDLLLGPVSKGPTWGSRPPRQCLTRSEEGRPGLSDSELMRIERISSDTSCWFNPLAF